MTVEENRAFWSLEIIIKAHSELSQSAAKVQCDALKIVETFSNFLTTQPAGAGHRRFTSQYSPIGQ